MRLRRILLSLTAFALALSSALPTSATAFTIPAGSTTSCKKNVSPVKDWWPNSGNSNDINNIKAIDMAVDQYGYVWVIVQNGNMQTASSFTIQIIDGTTFERKKSIKASDAGVTDASNSSSYALASIRRMGDCIVAHGGNSYGTTEQNVYIWKCNSDLTKVGKPTVKSIGSVRYGLGFGVYGDTSNGKLYFLGADGNNTMNSHTIKSESTIGSASTVNIDITRTSGRMAYVEPQSDGSFWVKNSNTYGIHYNANGTKKEEFTSTNMSGESGCGQRHFTFKGQKLALCMNYTGNTWISPTLSLIDYTSGVGDGQINILKDEAVKLSSHKQDAINFTACDYLIPTADKHLILYGLDCDGGIVRVEYDETSLIPATVPNFKAEAKWDGAVQKVTLSWDKTDKATSYRVYDYTAGETSETKVYDGADTSCTLDLAIGGGKEHKYRIKGINADGESAKSSYANTFDAGFGNIVLSALIEPDDATSTAKLEWNAPANGTLKDYTIVKSITKTAAGSTTSTTKDEDYATVAAGTTKYEYPNFSALSSVTEGGVTYSVATALYVRANMEQTVTTQKDEKISYVKSNTVTPVAAKAPKFTSVVTYTGRRTAALSWEVESTTNLNYYELYRDGILILHNTNAGSYIDTDLPDGTYTYQVIAFWEQNGTKYTTRSTTVSATIKYSSDVSTYILDTVYDYPIMTNDEWIEAGQPADAVVAKGWFANAKTHVGAWGAPGDVYRQAQFYNGKWYIAQLTARTELSSGGNYIPNNYSDLPSGTTSDKYKNDWKGHIYSIGADEATIRTIGTAGTRENDTYGLENQSIAVDEGGMFWHRVTNGGALNSTNVFYRPVKYLKGNILLSYGGQDFYGWEKSIDDPTTTANEGAVQQYYRTHYMSAGGNAAKGTGYVLLAMNKTPITYKVDLNTGGGSMKAITQFSAPYKDIKVVDKNGVEKDSDPMGSTENYAYPVAGRNAFIHTVRGIGTWYVDANTAKYTLMYSNSADVTQSGGVTFTYNNELFVLHPSSIRSNSPGNFVIDMVQRKAGETAATVVPSKDNLIPTVANKLDEITAFKAGNSNASWYGAEYSADDECVYIYQYVPGVRFAKYRLYIREQYPDVPPTLDITTGYNEDKTDITRFDSKITWQRPGTAHDYGLSENADITVDHYEVALKDKTGNTIQAWKDVKDVTKADHVFTLEYNKTAGGEYNLNSEKYTVEIVPIYKRKNGTIIRGASNFAVDNNDYPAAIGEVKAYIYNGTGSAAGMYRVDLDFDRALAAQSPEPVSYFLVEVSTDGGATFNTLSNFNLLKQGEDYHHYPVNVTNGQVPGQYKFGTTNVGDSPSEKGYALREHANHATEFPCVLYYYSNADPSNFKYRVTAVYASTNARIRKTASNNAENIIGGTSGIGDATGYSLSAYPVPATTEVTVTSPEAIRDIRVFSTSGAEVVRIAGEEGYTQSVDISNLAPGMYMLVVNEQTPIRIIKK